MELIYHTTLNIGAGSGLDKDGEGWNLLLDHNLVTGRKSDDISVKGEEKNKVEKYSRVQRTMQTTLVFFWYLIAISESNVSFVASAGD